MRVEAGRRILTSTKDGSSRSSRAEWRGSESRLSHTESQPKEPIMSRTLGFASLLLVIVAVLVPATALSSHGPATVKFKMVEWDILPLTATKSHSPVGKTTFVVRNAGKLDHEFVVIRTNKAAGQLAATGAAEAPEKGVVGEIEEIAPGKVKQLALTLKKGHYALICNLEGHWSKGQFVDFYIH
jgi:uncharacterized cupredoxin-like copper-binding protein